MKKNSEYENLSDEELIELYRGGETEIMDFLLKKYKNLVLSRTKSLFLLGGEADDLIQEGMIGLFQAVNDYDFGRDASFFTFAELCINRKIYNAIKSSNEKKHSFLNDYVSIYTTSGGENQEKENSPIIELIPSGNEANPENIALNNEFKRELEKAIKEQLSDLERENFLLYLTGMSSGEVAKVLGRSPKETDNSIQRAKNKVRKALTTDGKTDNKKDNNNNSK